MFTFLINTKYEMCAISFIIGHKNYKFYVSCISDTTAIINVALSPY